MNQNKRKYKSGFSLIEMLVSLAVISIIILIFFNTLLISLTVTIRNNIRSNTREELASILSLISKDIKASTRILDESCIDNSCTVVVDGEVLRWYSCESQICKDDGTDIIYKSDSEIIINKLDFQTGFVDESSPLKNNIIVTIVGDHANESLDINNLVRQVSISTRNYEL